MRNQNLSTRIFKVIAFSILACAWLIPLSSHALLLVIPVPQGCAPQSVTKNLEAVNGALTELSKRQDFASANTFKNKVDAIQKLSPELQLGEYLKIVGIDPNDDSAIVNFIGARTIARENVDSMMQNLALNREHAKVVIATLVDALRGADAR